MKLFSSYRIIGGMYLPNYLRCIIVTGLLLGPTCVYAQGLGLIALDPGHGGADSGVKGLSGALEKELTLVLAKKLAQSLQERLGARIVFTREQDETLTLYQRTAVANNLKADLFVSLHLNADFSLERTGLQIYTLDSSDYVKPGAQAPPSEVVIWEEAQPEFLMDSQRLAQAIYEQAQNSPAVRNCQVRQAPLPVLQGAHMPAILIEVTYLSSMAEEEKLLTGAYQQELLQVIYQGIMDYRDGLQSEE